MATTYAVNVTAFSPLTGFNPPTCDEICQITVSLMKKSRVGINNSGGGWLWASLAVYMPLSLFGIIGNIATIVMFGKYIKQTTTSIFIISLAIVDLIVCVVLMPIWFSELIIGDIVSDVLCKLHTLLTFIAIPMSGLILLIIALDRFFLIYLVKPSIITRSRAKVIVIVLFLACAALSAPQMFTASTWYPVPVPPLGTNCEEPKLTCNVERCRGIESPLLPITASVILWKINMALFLIMAFLFIIAYVLIFTKVYKLYRKMNTWETRNSTHRPVDVENHTFTSTHHVQAENGNDEMAEPVEITSMLGENGEEADDTKVTYKASTQQVDPHNTSIKTIHTLSSKSGGKVSPRKKKPPHVHTALILLAVTISFVVAYTPMIVLMIAKVCKNELKQEDPCQNNTSFYHFAWHLFYINHIMNPVIYSFMNPRFVEALKTCFFRWRTKEGS